MSANEPMLSTCRRVDLRLVAALAEQLVGVRPDAVVEVDDDLAAVQLEVRVEVVGQCLHRALHVVGGVSCSVAPARLASVCWKPFSLSTGTQRGSRSRSRRDASSRRCRGERDARRRVGVAGTWSVRSPHGVPGDHLSFRAGRAARIAAGRRESSRPCRRQFRLPVAAVPVPLPRPVAALTAWVLFCTFDGTRERHQHEQEREHRERPVAAEQSLPDAEVVRGGLETSRTLEDTVFLYEWVERLVQSSKTGISRWGATHLAPVASARRPSRASVPNPTPANAPPRLPSGAAATDDAGRNRRRLSTRRRRCARCRAAPRRR